MVVVVTGAGGFVGRYLVRQLLAQGEEVIAVDMRGESIPQGAHVVVGDIGTAQLRAAMFRHGCDSFVHLATVPGGAAEADSAASRRVNIDATYDLLEMAGRVGKRPRVVFASSIAALGDPLPREGVSDMTPLAPRMIYGGHKAMMEVAVSMMHRRGEIEGVSVRLPAILARSRGPAGMKSAFMSDIFHALRAGKPFLCPVSPGATIWAQSIVQCIRNLNHALRMDSSLMPETRALTLPALRFTIGELAAEVSQQCGVSSGLVSYSAEQALESAFGTYPPLATPAAIRAGFLHDGDLATLVRNALADIIDQDD